MAAQSSKRAVALIGKEGVGKSLLVSSLTGKTAYSSNFRGSTIYCDTYDTEEFAFIDTPGITRNSDSETTLTALKQLTRHDLVILVVQATHIDSDIQDFLPLVAGKKGVVVITYRDKISAAQNSLLELSNAWGIDIISVDARHISEDERKRILASLEQPRQFPERTDMSIGWCVQPKQTILEKRYVGSAIASFLIFLPSLTAVFSANLFAEKVDPLIKFLTRPLATMLGSLPEPISNILAGDYGFVTMGPLLFVWAVPTIVLYSILLGGYKASGLLERISFAMHPLLRPLGLSGRDLVRVIMGFGCNVPAVLSTRSCSACSRGTTISAIAFGSACSYQFGATLGVFAAAGKPWLLVPFLLFLSATTLIYTRTVSSRAGRSKLNILLTDSNRTFLEVPSPKTVWLESKSTIYQFFRLAIPIFFSITVSASILEWTGIMDAAAGVVGPIMGIFGLPGEAALAVVFGSIRKDGLLILAEPGLANALSPLQLLTSVYIAGVLLPCLVTLLTIIREQNWKFAAKMIGKQATAAVIFTLILAWAGKLLFN
jgi:Fe2+ transport system protein B